MFWVILNKPACVNRVHFKYWLCKARLIEYFFSKRCTEDEIVWKPAKVNNSVRTFWIIWIITRFGATGKSVHLGVYLDIKCLSKKRTWQSQIQYHKGMFLDQTANILSKSKERTTMPNILIERFITTKKKDNWIQTLILAHIHSVALQLKCRTRYFGLQSVKPQNL